MSCFFFLLRDPLHGSVGYRVVQKVSRFREMELILQIYCRVASESILKVVQYIKL